MAGFLTYLAANYEDTDFDKEKLFVTVPDHCEDVTRNSLLDACRIAGIKYPELVDESTATAYNYFREHQTKII